MQKITVSDARQPTAIGKEVLLQGWVRTRRDSKGGFSFIELNDGSCQGNVQILAEGKLSNYENVIRKLNVGASIAVVGHVVASPAKGQATEVKALEVTLLGEAHPESYPLQKKGTSFEFLRTIAHLRPRTNTFGAIARVRNQVCQSIHQFFQEQGFLYVHTPIITASDCEGAGELFKVSTLDFEKLPRIPSNPNQQSPSESSSVDYSRDFFGKPAFLTVSGQLQVEAYACSLGKVYTFGPTFRAENSNTPRHLAEFWMIEPEIAFYDLDDNMDLAESFIQRIVRDALTRCKEDMQFFHDRIDKTLLPRLEGILEGKFLRVPYTEAVDILEKSGQTWEFPVSWGKDLQSEHERFLTEKHFGKPLILFNYPRTLKPFYMRVN
ncbi:MAG TPA: asparagine--tRNA ligase, partial [Gemmatales bacterium]|nr:asparagine--tRNA ligase [Gemmatales bacterium]